MTLLAIDFENLHQVLRNLYQEMMPLCGDMIGVAKGVDRNAGKETLYFADRAPLNLDFDNPLLHYIQRLRDEAHRFAIGTHRIKRRNDTLVSALDNIKGIGAKRKKALLQHFGSVHAIKAVSVEEIAKVEGISPALAQHIFDELK